MISKEQKSKSKLLALWLRHKPELICDFSEVRRGAWIPWKFVVKGGVSLDMIKKIVQDDDKGRYSIDETRMWVRANQGHSFEVEMDYDLVTDVPETLFHGTVEKFLIPIMKQGLSKMRRTHVHLSPNQKTATQVGSRRGEAIILAVDAIGMVESGMELFISDNGVYLCDWVDPKFIKILF
jgi:putative RNA 2'-phosphotransferase